MDNYKQLSVLKNKVLADYMQDMVKFVERYQKFDSQTRFTLLVDKIQFMFKFLHGIVTVQTADDIIRIKKDKDPERTDEIKQEEIEQLNTLLEGSNKVFNLVSKELDALEDFIQTYGQLETLQKFRQMSMSDTVCENADYSNKMDPTTKPQ
jgi:hypothetical protein